MSQSESIERDTQEGKPLFKGVSFYEPRGTWFARLMHDGKKYKSPYFKTKEQAEDWYIEKVKELGLEDTKLEPRIEL